MQVKITHWIDATDNPLILRHDDGSVLIEVIDLAEGRALDVFLAPALFPALRRAMDKAEGSGAHANGTPVAGGGISGNSTSSN